LIKGTNNQFERLSSKLTTTATSRPTVVIVIAVLNIIGGIIMLIIGPPLAFAGTIIPFVLQSIPEQQQQSMTSGGVDLSQVSPSIVGAGILALGWY
jgi:ABC-type transport system involved in cytochrome bd biosynthesis fused ATPase/permease subunit